jgi:ribosomal protein S18 acetylase RimI-like enzyme
MTTRARTREKPQTDLDRALQFIRQTIEMIAEDVRPIEGGFVVRTASLPEVWGMNHLRIIEPVSPREALALADEHLAGLPYHQIHVENDKTGRALERSLVAEGWRMEREVLMALDRGPDREVDTDRVIEAGEDQTLALMRHWYLEGPPETTPDTLRQLVEYARREGRARGDRNFGVPGLRGDLVAMTKLRSGGGTAQIEDVYTVPEARGRGHARALVTHASVEARAGAHELIFIVADDNDWPKHLYGQIGYEPIGWTWAFHKTCTDRVA